MYLIQGKRKNHQNRRSTNKNRELGSFDYLGVGFFVRIVEKAIQLHQLRMLLELLVRKVVSVPSFGLDHDDL